MRRAAWPRPARRFLIHATLQRTASAAFLVALLGPGQGHADAQPPLPETTHAAEKGQRSPEEKKIDSQLLYALYARRGESAARGTPTETSIEVDGDGRTLIDVRAEVTPELLGQIRALGGTVESTSEAHRSVLARFPLERLVELASQKSVLFIQPAARAVTN